jgi:signal peptidase I
MGWLKKILRHSVWIFVIIGSVALVSLVRCFAFSSVTIPTDGMAPSLYSGERILVNRWSYGLRLPLMSLFGYHRLHESKPAYGDVIVFNNPLSRSASVERRELFISRCIARPGDTVMVDSCFSLLSAGEWRLINADHNYSIPKERMAELDSLLCLLSIPADTLMELDSLRMYRNFSHADYCKLEAALDTALWVAPIDSGVRPHIHKLVVPARGMDIAVDKWNRTLLMNTLILHEGRDVCLAGDTLLVDGEPATTCHFNKDYYWVLSDYVRNTSDSRLFGFLPSDHIVGRASVVWYSKDPKQGLLSGYRSGRFFHKVK